jgi:hypothetical protein
MGNPKTRRELRMTRHMTHVSTFETKLDFDQLAIVWETQETPKTLEA